MRALANLNASDDGLASWAPTINLLRDPRWGRSQEVPSEDPLVAGEYGVQFTRGLQEGDVDATPGEFLIALSTLKHFVAYSLEDYSPSGNFSDHTFTRQNFSAEVTQRDLEDGYYPAFQRSIQKANAQGIM
jgi:beta-D-xylosidase 4